MANRAMHRQQEREQIREWRKSGEMGRVQRLIQNGITQKDLDKWYEDGFKAGLEEGSDAALRTVYAGIVLCLLDAGNSRDEAISFPKSVDERLVVSIDAGEDIEEVYERTGIHLKLKEDFDRIREVKA